MLAIIIAIIGAHERYGYDINALQQEANENGYEIHLRNGMIIRPKV